MQRLYYSHWSLPSQVLLLNFYYEPDGVCSIWIKCHHTWWGAGVDISILKPTGSCRTWWLWTERAPLGRLTTKGFLLPHPKSAVSRATSPLKLCRIVWWCVQVALRFLRFSLCEKLNKSHYVFSLSVKVEGKKQPVLSSKCIVLYCILVYVCAYVSSPADDVLHMSERQPQIKLQIVWSHGPCPRPSPSPSEELGVCFLDWGFRLRTLTW